MIGPSPEVPGGVAAHIADLARTLEERGIEVVRIVTSKSSRTAQGVVGKWNIRKPLDLPRVARWAFGRKVVFHAHEYLPTSGLALLKKFLPFPLVLTIHGYYHSEWSLVGGHPYMSARGVLAVERRAIRGASRIIAVDERISRWCLNTYKRQVDLVWRNAVRPQEIRVQEHGGESLILVCPRALTPKNGVQTAIEAMARLREAGLPFHLKVLGDGPLREELIALTKKLGLEATVSFLGSLPREAVLSNMRSAFTVLIPSVSIGGVEEATSIAALEAMASGVPVIASDIGGLREIVENRAAGILVPPGSPDSLANAILELSSDLYRWREMSRRARLLIEEKHNLSKQVVQIERLYRSLLN